MIAGIILAAVKGVKLENKNNAGKLKLEVDETALSGFVFLLPWSKRNGPTSNRKNSLAFSLFVAAINVACRCSHAECILGMWWLWASYFCSANWGDLAGYSYSCVAARAPFFLVEP